MITNSRQSLLILSSVALVVVAISAAAGLFDKLEPEKKSMTENRQETDTLPKSEEEWKKILTPEQFYILRKKGTERAFSGKYWDAKEEGVYCCAGCGQPLFSAETKFDSGTGWPSFWKPVDEKNVAAEDDSSFFMRRTEVHCSRCEGHLGHVFADGPEPTGLRYCINSDALKLDESP